MNIEVESKQKEGSTFKSQPTIKEKFLFRIKLALGIILLIVSIVSGYTTMKIILLFTGLILIFDPLIAGTLASLRFCRSVLTDFLCSLLWKKIAGILKESAH